MNQFSLRAVWSVLGLAIAATTMSAAALAAASGSGAAAPAAPAKGSAPGKESSPAQGGAPTNEDDKMLYELGVLMSQNLDNFQLSESEFKLVSAGLTDGYHHRADAAQAVPYEAKLQALLRTRVAATSTREKELGQAYLEKAAAAPGARKTATGLIYIPITEGNGASPAVHDQVKLNYEGRLIDGTVFDSSAAHGQPATLVVGNVIPCFNEALPLMKVGGKSRIVCPSELAYGDRGAAPKIKPGEPLEFVVELVEITPPPTTTVKPVVPPAAPAPAGK